MNVRTGRRAWLRAGATLVLAGLLAGACGDDDDDAGGDTTAPGAASTTTAGGSGTTAPASDDPLAPQPLAETAEVTIGMSAKFMLFAPILLADQLGEFERENLDVNIEIASATDWPLLVDQGELDAVGGAFAAGVLNFIESGGDVRAVFPMENEYVDDSEAGIWMRTDAMGDDGFQASDLEGVDIAFASGISGSGLAYLWDEVLKPEGFDPSDLRATVLSVPDTVIGLTQGSVDVGLVASPFTEEVRESGCCEYIGGNPPFPVAWVFFGDRLLNQEPDVGRAVLRAIARTITEYLDGDFLEDPEKVATIAEALEQPVEAVEATPETFWDLEATDPAAVLEPLWEFWLPRGDIVAFTEPLEVEDTFNLTFFEELFPDIPVR